MSAGLVVNLKGGTKEEHTLLDVVPKEKMRRQTKAAVAPVLGLFDPSSVNGSMYLTELDLGCAGWNWRF